jgi:hypothetical protein
MAMLRIRSGRRFIGCLLVLGCALSSTSSWAVDNVWTRGASSFDWNVGGNWSFAAVPQAVPFEEEAVIENGDTVFIANAVPDVAGIVLARTAGTTGRLEVRAGGSVNAIDSTGTPVGAVQVGVDGAGRLDVLPGGSLSAQSLSLNAQSTLNIGGTGGAATLNVAGTMALNGASRVIGSTASVTAGTVSFGGTSAHTAELRAATHSPIRTTGGSATLNGAFKAALGVGFTPTVGTSWNIVDAAGISGNFSSVDLSAFTLGPGQAARLARVAGGVNGQLLQLQYRNVLTLNVDWTTHAVSISSPSGQSIAIDGYSILSGSGGLSVSQWNSLQDQGTSGWAEATPTATALNELNSNVGGSLNITSTPRALGTPFAPIIGPLGQNPEDLVFEYSGPSGEIVQGLVNYTGNRVLNNLLLTVDPATGQGQLKNSTLNPMSFDGYSITSSSGSLRPAAGNWSSLADQGISPWQEATPTVNALSELRTSGFTTLAPGASFNLGNLFTTTGAKDLQLEFSMQGDPLNQFRIGTVIYSTLSASNADFNGNGRVDGNDLMVWQRGLGITSGATLGQGDANADGSVNGADLAIWRAQFGTGSAAVNGVAVPEPAAFVVALSFVGLAIPHARVGLRKSAQLRKNDRLA